MKVVAQSDSNLQAIFEDVHVIVWRKPLEPEGLETSLKVGLEMMKTFPEGFWAFNVVTGGLAIPSLSLQRRASEVTRTVDPCVKGAVVVLPGRGFWVSAARSFLIGLELISPLKSKREVASSVGEGCRLLARRAGRSDAWAASLADSVAAMTDARQ